MVVGELLVKMGITGGDKAKRELGSVQKGLGGIVSASAAAKAGVLAMLYGLERMTGWASQAGMDLRSFSMLTGESTQELQRWQHAAMLYGAGADEVAGSVVQLKDAMTNMLLGKGAPEGFATMMDDVGLDPSRIKDTFYVLGKIQEFAKRHGAVAATMMKSMGFSDKMIVAMRQLNLARDGGKKGDFITKAEEERLTRMNREWKEFWYQLEQMGKKTIASPGFAKGFDEFSDGAKRLVRLAKDINGVTSGMAGLAAAATVAGAAVMAAFGPIGPVVAGLLYILQDIQAMREWEKANPNAAPGSRPKSGGDKIMHGIDSWLQGITKDIGAWWKGAESPATAGKIPLPYGGKDVKVQITNHNHIQSTDPKGVARELGGNNVDQVARQIEGKVR